MKFYTIAAAVLLPVVSVALVDGDEHWLYGYPDTSPESFGMEKIGDYIYMGGLFFSVDGVRMRKILLVSAFLRRRGRRFPEDLTGMST